LPVFKDLFVAKETRLPNDVSRTIELDVRVPPSQLFSRVALAHDMVASVAGKSRQVTKIVHELFFVFFVR
jgi:hypothetical protein